MANLLTIRLLAAINLDEYQRDGRELPPSRRTMKMKIDKFIKKVNKNDRLFAEKGHNLINIYDDGGTFLMKIPNNATNWLEIDERVTYFSNWIGKPSCEYLSAMIEKLLHTPIDERFSENKYIEKKYTVQVIHDNKCSFLNFKDDGRYEITSDRECDGYQTSFTEQEIKKLMQRDDIAIDWNKAKIKEVEDSDQ